MTKANEQSSPCGSLLSKKNESDDILRNISLWRCSFCGSDVSKGLDKDPSVRFDVAEAYHDLHVDTVAYIEPSAASSVVNEKPGANTIMSNNYLSAKEAKWPREAAAVVYAPTAERGLLFALLSPGSGCSIAVYRQRLEDV